MPIVTNLQHIFIIDTSLSGVAVATAQLTTNSFTLADKFICTQKRTAERALAVETQRILAHAPPPHKIIVAIGPGSFTGIRIGIAFACGLAAAPQQLLGISSLQAITAWLATQHNTAVRLYHAITADSGVVAHIPQADDEVTLANVNLPTLPPAEDEAQVFIAGSWPRLAMQLGAQAKCIDKGELLDFALQALAWQAQRMITIEAQEWPRPLYVKEPYTRSKT